MSVPDYKINYKSDFVLTINGDAGWAVPFCIKFWTGMPSQAYFVGFDGVKYVNCRVGDTPTQLLVMFDDHHLPIGPLRMQIAYHTTIEDFPGSVFDEVTNARDVIVTIDGTDYQVMLDFTGEDAPELEFDLPAYANEAERIQNELQRQQNEQQRIAAELQREQATATAVEGAENVNAQLSGTTLTVTNRQGVSTSVNTKGEQGERGPVGPEGPQGEQGPQGIQGPAGPQGIQGPAGPQGETGISIVSFLPKSETATNLIYTITFSNGHTQDVAIPKGPKGDTGATGPTGPQGPQGDTGVSITGFVETGETETATLYTITFSNGTTQQVAIPKGEKGDQGPVGPQGPQGPMGDVAVITPEQQVAFTMYNTTGQNTDGPMTQKAVTDALNDDTTHSEEINLNALTAKNGFLATSTGWVIPTKGFIRQHVSIPVAEGEWYRITANSSKNAYWNYLKSDQIPTVNNELYNSDYQLQSTSAVGETVEFQIPAGHTWLAIDKSNTSANDFLPASLCKVTKLENVVDRLNSVESELDVLDDCIKLDNIASGLAITKDKGISKTGSIVTANGYCYTEPVYIESGIKISVTYCGGSIAVMSLVDGSAYVPKITDNRIDINNGQATQEYTTEVSGHYVFSYLYTRNDIDVPFYAYKNLSFNDALKGEEYDITVMSDYSYITSDLAITPNSHSNTTHYFVTNPISLRKNQTIIVNTLGGYVWIVAQYENNRITKGLVFSELKTGALYSAYSYTARDDMDVVVCGVDNVFSPLKVYIKSEEQSIADTLVKFNNEMFGIYLYPFRAIVNKEVWMYKDSLVSGLNPMQNYNVQCVENRNDYLVDYGKYSMYYKTPTAGVSELTITATDQYDNTIRKTVKVTSVSMPSVKLENEESIDVLFMGDSLIGFNYNLIGAEFKRMLATSDEETHIDPVTHAIQLPTLNICPNKINLVGEQSNPANGARYTYIYRLQQILTGKRTRQYNANIGTTTYADMNPFYNPNSSNPDTVGSDGFNQRVDFEWYFTNACGEGKYPKLFYIAIGANDVYYNNWSADTSDIANNLILLIKKLKSVCDGIAGGDSGIKIKVFNHQFYPLHNMFKYEAPLLQQRIAWQALYDSYYNAINDPLNEVSDYAELIDCGSKFDWRVGYTQEDVATNVRYNGNQDIHIEEACHMNNVGAYNYADCLITDFLADTDFD